MIRKKNYQIDKESPEYIYIYNVLMIPSEPDSEVHNSSNHDGMFFGFQNYVKFQNSLAKFCRMIYKNSLPLTACESQVQLHLIK